MLSVCASDCALLSEVGCSFVEATYAPSVQEVKQGESEDISTHK